MTEKEKIIERGKAIVQITKNKVMSGTVATGTKNSVASLLMSPSDPRARGEHVGMLVRDMASKEQVNMDEAMAYLDNHPYSLGDELKQKIQALKDPFNDHTIHSRVVFRTLILSVYDVYIPLYLLENKLAGKHGHGLSDTELESLIKGHNQYDKMLRVIEYFSSDIFNIDDFIRFLTSFNSPSSSKNAYSLDIIYLAVKEHSIKVINDSLHGASN